MPVSTLIKRALWASVVSLCFAWSFPNVSSCCHCCGLPDLLVCKFYSSRDYLVGVFVNFWLGGWIRGQTDRHTGGPKFWLWSIPRKTNVFKSHFFPSVHICLCLCICSDWPQSPFSKFKRAQHVRTRDIKCSHSEVIVAALFPTMSHHVNGIRWLHTVASCFHNFCTSRVPVWKFSAVISRSRLSLIPHLTRSDGLKVWNKCQKRQLIFG